MGFNIGNILKSVVKFSIPVIGTAAALSTAASILKSITGFGQNSVFMGGPGGPGSYIPNTNDYVHLRIPNPIAWFGRQLQNLGQSLVGMGDRLRGTQTIPTVYDKSGVPLNVPGLVDGRAQYAAQWAGNYQIPGYGYVGNNAYLAQAYGQTGAATINPGLTPGGETGPTLGLVNSLNAKGTALLSPTEKAIYDKIEDPKQKELFLLQKQLQWQQQLFTMLTNIAQMRHEAAMTTIRNYRA